MPSPEAGERRIYCDACVYITLIDGTDRLLANAIAGIFQYAGFHGTRIVTSELTIAETLIKPAEIAKQSGDLSRYNLFDLGMFSNQSRFLDLVSVNRDVLTLSAHLRAELRLQHNIGVKLPDAIHIASAVIGRCDTIITGDDKMLKAAACLSDRPAGKAPVNIIGLEINALNALQRELPSPWN